jgi:hypothetical protein
MEWHNLKKEMKSPEQGKIVLIRVVPEYGSYDIGYFEIGHGFTSLLTRRRIQEVTHWAEISAVQQMDLGVSNK